MNLSGNTVLITGGGSGIGMGLAGAFHALGNRVVIAGRRESSLQQVAEANPGMEYIVADQSTASGVQDLAATALERFPALNVLINNAGMQRVEDLSAGATADAEATIHTNLLGPIRLTAALMQHLLRQTNPVIINVSSALGMMPACTVPTYCATKAALHSYTQSLRHQLGHTSVQVIEMVPPAVQTELHGEREQHVGMPLDEYITEVMALLTQHPEAKEIVAERAKRFRFAAREDYDTLHKSVNDRLISMMKR